MSDRQQKVLEYLKAHDIPFSCYEHPEGKTIEEAKRWWKDDGSVHCKNIFMRNHKGNQHYLICFHCDHDLDIHDLEARLKAALQAQGKPSCGKLSFASPERMMKYLGLEPGSVSPFGLINDQEHHVHLFLLLPPQRLPRHSSHRPRRLRAIPQATGQHLRIHQALLKKPAKLVELVQTS